MLFKFALPTTIALLFAFLLGTATVTTAQSPIECLVGMDSADVDGSSGLDAMEYLGMLSNFAAAYHDGCSSVRGDSTSFQSHFPEAACLCQDYTAVNTTAAVNYSCACNTDDAVVAVPGIYPSIYTTNICNSILSLLQSTCDTPPTSAPSSPTDTTTNAPSPLTVTMTEAPSSPKPTVRDPFVEDLLQEEEEDDSGNSAAIVVPVVLVLVFVGAVAALFVYRRRKMVADITLERGFPADGDEPNEFKPNNTTAAATSGGGAYSTTIDTHDTETTETETTESTMEEGLDLLAAAPAELKSARRPNPLDAVPQSSDQIIIIDPSEPSSYENGNGQWVDALSVISEAEKQTMAYEFAENDDDDYGDNRRRGPVDIDELAENDDDYDDNDRRRGPVDVDDGGFAEDIPAPATSPVKATSIVYYPNSPVTKKKKKSAGSAKLPKSPRSAKLVRAAYKEKARSRSSGGLQPIMETTIV